ncbi:hypothetical protein LL946_16470 [Knoellia locipacati]|uniref:hypothetical protein n=1 Tax=Knoellia locipacati TaxID=882824 RepID=UPI00384E4082
MLPVTPARRLAAQVSLVAAPVLVLVSTLTQPDFGDGSADRLTAVASDGAALSAVTFLVAQLPMLVVFLAIGLLLVPTAPRLSAWGTASGVLGCFGHSVFGGLSAMQLVMARDTDARETYVALLDDLESSPLMAFAAVGLIGTVVGFLLLGIGLFRTRTGPVWVGPAIWAFLVVEFVGSNLSDSAVYLSNLIIGLALVALVPVVGGRGARHADDEDVRSPHVEQVG